MTRVPEKLTVLYSIQRAVMPMDDGAGGNMPVRLGWMTTLTRVDTGVVVAQKWTLTRWGAERWRRRQEA